jgi:hypothetical protein
MMTPFPSVLNIISYFLNLNKQTGKVGKLKMYDKEACKMIEDIQVP